MKELSIEQKAKAYDETLNRAKKVHKYSSDLAEVKRMEDIFPELKDSEDKMIRDEIISYLKSSTAISPKTWLAWLKRQGEQKSDNKTKAEHLIPQNGMYYTCIKDYYASDNTHLCVKGHVYKSFFNGYIDDESHLGLSWTNSCAEKYFEPTKDEDWIVCEHDNIIGKPMQYKEFKKEVNQKFIKNLKAQGITPKLRLWNIRDAKAGDVLSDETTIFIFKDLLSDDSVMSYCDYDTDSGESDAFCPLSMNLMCSKITPATKEQRNTLFAKMREAGYEWDADKKELKKIVVPIFNVGDTIIKKHNSDIHDFGSFPITDIKDGKYWYNDGIICDVTEQDEWEIYEPVKQNTTEWSEDDERMYRGLHNLIYSTPYCDSRKELSDWLQSLKDRVQLKDV